MYPVHFVFISNVIKMIIQKSCGELDLQQYFNKQQLMETGDSNLI